MDSGPSNMTTLPLRSERTTLPEMGMRSISSMTRILSRRFQPTCITPTP